MDHVVSYVVDLAWAPQGIYPLAPRLRTYRACVRDSLAAKGLTELLFGLGYTVKKGDLAGIPWKARSGGL